MEGHTTSRDDSFCDGKFCLFHPIFRFWSLLETNDLSIAWTKTKYIKLNTKTQNIFCFLNENLTTFFIHFDRGDKKTKGEKKFSLSKCIQKSNVIKKIVFGFSRCNGLINTY